MTAPRAAADITFNVYERPAWLMVNCVIVMPLSDHHFDLYSAAPMSDNQCLKAIQDWYERVERRKREILAEEL